MKVIKRDGRTVDFDDMNIIMEYMNDHSHVPDEYMPKRSRIVSKVENKQ